MATPRNDATRPGDGPPLPGGDSPPLLSELRPPGPVRFAITQTQRSGAISLQIVGELDILTAPKLAAELNDAVRRSSDDVIVDLRRTEFMDSAGLQVLLGVRRRLSNASRRLTVLCDGGRVRRVIELARLSEALGVVGPESAVIYRRRAGASTGGRLPDGQ